MCYAYPGPRCSSHARDELKKARENYREVFTNSALPETSKSAAVAELQAAVDTYDTTNAGQKSLDRRIQEHGDPDGMLQLRKDRGELLRKSQMYAYHKKQAQDAAKTEADGTPDCSGTEEPLTVKEFIARFDKVAPYSDEVEGRPEKVEVKEYGTFYRSDAYPHNADIYFLRIQADEDLSDEEVTHLAQLTGYAYRTNVRGEPLGNPHRDSKRSFVVHADTTKSSSDDVGYALHKFEDELPGLAEEGTPRRKSNRAGPGTAGTRLVNGLGKDKGITIYYG